MAEQKSLQESRILDYAISLRSRKQLEENPFFGLYLKNKKDWKEKLEKNYGSHIHRLDLSSNNLSSKEITWLSEFLRSFEQPNLKDLVLYDNCLGYSECKIICEYLIQHQRETIELLEFSKNNLNEECIPLLINLIEKCPNLVDIKIHLNSIHLKNQMIAEYLKENQERKKIRDQDKKQDEFKKIQELKTVCLKFDQKPWDEYMDRITDLETHCKSIGLNFHPYYWHVIRYNPNDTPAWIFKFRTKLFYENQKDLIYPCRNSFYHHSTVSFHQAFEEFPYPYYRLYINGDKKQITVDDNLYPDPNFNTNFDEFRFVLKRDLNIDCILSRLILE